MSFENRDSAGKGQLFDQAVADPIELIQSVAHDACRTLYRNAAEVKPVESIQLVVGDFAGVATTSGSSMRLSSNHLQVTLARGADVAREIAGVLHFTVANVYQHDGEGTAPTWLITGVADFVRLDAQLIDSGARVQGGNYDDGSAFFLDFLTSQNPDVVYLLNRRLAPAASPWNDDAFIEVMGVDVATLWAAYQQTL